MPSTTMIPKWQWLIFKRAIGRKNRYKPFSRSFGHERGRPVDRYYIDRFIAAEAECVRGRVLEIGDNNYTREIGGERVTQSDVLMPVPDPDATVIADLQDAPAIPDGSFDCIILTQVLQCIYDHHAAVRTMRRILKPGGAVLATLPFISALSGVDMAQWGEQWRYTSHSARRIFGDVFGPDNVEVRTYGNLVLAMAYLNGFAVEDLDPEDFEHVDPLIELISTVKATKAAVPAALAAE
jgi:SAM-dependent methyltransferase